MAAPKPPAFAEHERIGPWIVVRYLGRKGTGIHKLHAYRVRCAHCGHECDLLQHNLARYAAKSPDQCKQCRYHLPNPTPPLFPIGTQCGYALVIGTRCDKEAGWRYRIRTACCLQQTEYSYAQMHKLSSHPATRCRACHQGGDPLPRTTSPGHKSPKAAVQTEAREPEPQPETWHHWPAPDLSQSPDPSTNTRL